VAKQAAAVVGSSTALVSLVVWLLSKLGALPELASGRYFVISLGIIVSSALFAGLLSQRLVGARLGQLVRVIDGAGPNDDLLRIRDLGPDEVGAIGHAINRLLARMTSIRASMIDQERELSRAQRELALKASLSAKTEELSQRLEERAMLFDILRMTTSSQELDQVLHTLVERLGHLLRLREVVIFIHDEGTEDFVVRAAYGFPREEAVVGRSVKFGEGISGRVGKTREPLIVTDVSREETYLGFWGHAAREGSLAAVPLVHQDRLLGVLTITRPEQDPITDVQLHLLQAIADNASLAIRNAQLFTRMRQLSTQDELTGLANRRLFHTQLGMEIDRARRFEKPLSLVAIDIDHFKLLNDRHGHPVGDAALREVAALLGRSVRKIDTVARVGGEEFMVLLPRADIREAVMVAGKLHKAVLATDFPGGKDQPEGRLTVSLGVSQLAITDDRHGESLIGRADQALYAAKHAGRNRVFVVESPHAVESVRPPAAGPDDVTQTETV
jgi:diguanylate cyclase (GGDEF)-like protein